MKYHDALTAAHGIIALILGVVPSRALAAAALDLQPLDFSATWVRRAEGKRRALDPSRVSAIRSAVVAQRDFHTLLLLRFFSFGGEVVLDDVRHASWRRRWLFGRLRTTCVEVGSPSLSMRFASGLGPLCGFCRGPQNCPPDVDLRERLGSDLRPERSSSTWINLGRSVSAARSRYFRVVGGRAYPKSTDRLPQLLVGGRGRDYTSWSIHNGHVGGSRAALHRHH